MRKYLLLVLTIAAAGYALTAWPLLSDVETGRTPEYPDLRPREYAADAPSVAAAVKKAIARLPRFTFVGEGHGPGGAEIQALARTPVVRLEHDVTVRVSRRGAVTHVSVRSRSRVGPYDFGQNARNIRELLSALDEELGGRR